MTDRLDLPPRYRDQLEALLHEYVPDAEVWAYGSRVNGQSHPGSDLDLVIRSSTLEPLGTEYVELIDALEMSNIPILVQAHDWAHLPDFFHSEIKQDYVVLQEGSGQEPHLRDNWTEVTLGDCAYINESTYSLKEGWPFINYLETGDITDGVISGMRLLSTTEDKIPSRARRRVQQGDIVYSTVRPNQRHYGRIKNLPENCLVSTGFAVIHARRAIAHTDFIYWYLTQDHIVDYLQTLAEHSTSAYPSIKPGDLAALPILLPPLPEQRAIANILDKLDDKIELNRRMNKTLEDMARALFKSWFVDFKPVRAKMEGHWRPDESLPGLPPNLYSLFPDRLVDSELGTIPDGWQIGTLKDVIEVNPRRSIQRGAMAAHVAMAAIPKSGPHVVGWTRRAFTSGSRFARGDTLLARITPSLENGKTALVDFLSEGEIGWGSTELIVMRPKHPWPLPFAYLLARNPNFRRHAIMNMTGTSGRQRVPPKAITSYALAIPPRNVAVAFGRIVQPWFEPARSITRQSRTLAWVRDTLLSQLLSGSVHIGDNG